MFQDQSPPLGSQPFFLSKAWRRGAKIAFIGGTTTLVAIGLIGSAYIRRIDAVHHPSAAAPSVKPTISQAERLALRIFAWEQGPGLQDAVKLGSQLDAISRSAKAGNLPAIKRACARLATDVMAARAAPQIPDPAAEKDYAAGLAQYSIGATECQTAVSSRDEALYGKAVSKHLLPGLRDIGKATKRLNAILAAAGR